MPFKRNASRRYRIPKARYRVQNWPAYEAGLRRRGDLTLWLDDAAIDAWQAAPRTTPGGQARYSDLAIELVPVLRLVFHLALRQAEGFARSVLRLLGHELRVPDHTTLARRGRGSAGRHPEVAADHPLHLVIDSSGLQVFGRGEWDEEKHGRARRSWRKLHIAVDANTGEIVACVLTDNAAHDAGQVPDLLSATPGEIASVTADGAYDGEPVYQAVARRQSDPVPDIVIPPRSSAVPSSADANRQSRRDEHIRIIAERGRMAWQRETGYGRRSLAETAVGRYKNIIGARMRARGLPGQQGGVAIAADVLNRMIRIARPHCSSVA